MHIKNDLNTSFSFYIAIVPATILIGLLLSEIYGNLTALLICFSISFLITCWHATYYFGILSLYAIFLYTSAFFIYDSFFITIFGTHNFLEITYPRNFYFEESIGRKFILSSSLLVYIMHLAYCLFAKEKKRYKRYIYRDEQCEKIGQIIMILFFVPCIWKLAYQLSYVMTHGYFSIFKGGLGNIKYPWYLKGAYSGFLAGYAIFLAGNPTRKKYIFYSFILLGVVLFDSMKGQRGPFLCTLTFFIYWYYRKYNQTIKIGTIIIICIFTISFTSVVLSVRNNYGTNSNSNHMYSVIETVYSQTGTRAVPMLVMKENLEFHDYPFIFSPFMKIINKIKYPTVGQTKIALEHYNDISNITMYSVWEDAYYSGAGYGGAFIAEAYDCGRIYGIIFWGIMLAFFLSYCDFSRLAFSRFSMPLMFFILKDFAFLPRNRLFAVLEYIYAIIFVYGCIFFIKILFNRRFFRIRYEKK